MEIFNTFFQHLDVFLSLGGAIVCCASLIVAGTPTPSPESTLGKVYRVIEWAALVFGRAKEDGRAGAVPTAANESSGEAQGDAKCGK